MNRPLSQIAAACLLCMIFSVVESCSLHPYRSTNRHHKKQLKASVRILKKYPLPYNDSLTPYFVGTTNFSLRKPNYVVIHHTAQKSCDETLKTFTLTRTKVSAHYVICRDGKIFHMLHDLLRAHHAGVSRWGNDVDLNSSSVGIEIDNNGNEPFTEVQIRGLLQLLGQLKTAYSIPTANFIGHADVATGRKVDPSRYFPWKTLADNGFGYWYDSSSAAFPSGFDPVQALRIIGYRTYDTAAAIQSFKIHFLPQDTTRTLSEENKRILYNLMLKYL